MSHNRLWNSSGADRGGHLVAADDPVWFDGAVQFRAFELLARDVGQHHAVAPGERQLSIGVDQPGILGQRVDHLVRVVPGLLQRIRNVLGNALRQDLPGLLARRADGLEPPILHFEDEQPAPGMQHDEIGMRVRRTDRHVIPDQVVVVELLLESLGGSSLPLSHARDAGAQSRYDGRHFVSRIPESGAHRA
jgi:hypothetical protein